MVTWHNKRLIAGVIGVAALSLVLGAASMAIGSVPVTTANCREKLVVDYLDPLLELPPVRPVPRSGRLPFGGEGVTLRPVSQGQVKVNGTRAGYALSLDGPFSKFNPGWQVEAQLLQVDSNGKTLKLVQRRERVLGVPRSLTDLDFSFRLQSDAGLYKYVIQFVREGGRALGRYSQYLRIVKPRLSGRFRLSADSTMPGSSLQFQIANLGTVSFAASVTPIIELWEPTGWKVVDIPQGRVIRKALRLEAGHASSCFDVHIPSSAATGLYRIGVTIAPLSLPSRFVRNRFEVLPRSIRSE